MSVRDAAMAAKDASRHRAALPLRERDAALIRMADALIANREAVFQANALDIESASSLPEPLIKRLKYDQHKLDESIAELRALAELPDPLNQTQRATRLADGLNLYRVSCPLGVIGMIFESRPDALIQMAALCLKTGNAVLLKGGSEAVHTNRALFAAIPNEDHWAALFTSREDVADMLALDEYISLLIPRGSGAFVRYIMDNTRIPVLGHAEGLCHMYVDDAADVNMAARIAADSKLQYPAVCNAAETLLIHNNIADTALPAIVSSLSGCECRCDERSYDVITKHHAASKAVITHAAPADWDAEYLDAIISIKVVDSIDEAITHINRHGSGHTDAIVTSSQINAFRFINEVDSADVMWNASTRFSDGYRYGLGAEVGVSTSRIHARGPVGMEGLTTYKYVAVGEGHTVGGFADGTYTYKHEALNESLY